MMDLGPQDTADWEVFVVLGDNLQTLDETFGFRKSKSAAEQGSANLRWSRPARPIIQSANAIFVSATTGCPRSVAGLLDKPTASCFPQEQDYAIVVAKIY
jgi:hypothetical protein